MSGYPDGNPKTSQGAMKVPLHLVPPSATYFLALAFRDGATKYGPYNWRDKGVSASVYYGAALRHLSAWFDGEDVSPDALVHHLAHVMACCAIVLDALTVDKLNDDRPTPGASPRLQADFLLCRAIDAASLKVPEPETIVLADGVTAVMPHGVAQAYYRDVLHPDDDESQTPAELPREHAA